MFSGFAVMFYLGTFIFYLFLFSCPESSCCRVFRVVWFCNSVISKQCDRWSIASLVFYYNSRCFSIKANLASWRTSGQPIKKCLPKWHWRKAQITVKKTSSITVTSSCFISTCNYSIYNSCCMSLPILC